MTLSAWDYLPKNIVLLSHWPYDFVVQGFLFPWHFASWAFGPKVFVPLAFYPLGFCTLGIPPGFWG